MKKAGFSANFKHYLVSFLESKGAKLPADILALLQQGELDLVEQVIYYNSNKINNLAAGGAVTDLIESTQNKQVGITNLEKGRTDTSQYFVVGGISLAFAQEAQADQGLFRNQIFANLLPTTAAANPGEQAGFVPTVLLNSEFSIVSNNRTILDARPVSDFFTFGNVNGGAMEDGQIVTVTPKLIEPNSKIDARIKTPQTAQAAGGATDLLQVKLWGIGFVRK